MTIRTAEPRDAAVIADFNIALALETEGLRLDPTCVNAGVTALLADTQKGLYFVAEEADEVVGQVMITYEWSDWRNANIWWLQSVYVRPDFRGRGVFRALFEHLRKLASSADQVCGLRLYMHEENARARKSYESLGMTQTKYLVFELDFRASDASHH